MTLNRLTPSFKREYILLALLESILLGIAPLLALDPNKRITQYDIRLYQAEHGLPMNDIKAVFQDSKGYIWLGCQEGLVRFDGVRFVLFDKSRYPGLRENFIWDIKEDWDGNLWLATNGGGVACFDGKAFKSYTTEQGLASDMAFDIAIGNNHRIYFATEGGVSIWEEGKLRTLVFGNPAATQWALRVHEDSYGNLLIGNTQTGLHIVNSVTQYSPAMDEWLVFFGLGSKRNGDIVLGTSLGKIFLWQDQRIRPYQPAELPTPYTIRAIHEDVDENLWFCTEGGGIVRYAQGRFESLTPDFGLSAGHKFFTRVIEDREGSLWFVGDGGLLKLSDNKFVAFGRVEGLADNFGSTVCEDKAGKIWVGLRQDGVLELDRFSIKSWKVEETFDHNMIGAVFPATGGGLWIGTFTDLRYFNNGLLRTFRDKMGMHQPNILSLLENIRGELWIGSAHGYLTKYDGHQFTRYQLVDSISGESGNVTSIVERSGGEVLAGTVKKGLYRLIDGDIYRFSTKDGFTANGVNALYEDDEHVLWIATDEQGLYRYKNGQFVNINSSHGLYFDRLFSILEDDQGNLWFSGNRGIFRTGKQQLNDYAEGKADTIICQSYNHLDGMRQAECNGRRQPVAWKSRDGRLWFVSTAGVVSVDPNNMPINEVIPPVYIEEITANQHREIALDAGAISLASNERELAIRYTALSYAIPERVYFKYKLEGYDHDWIDAGTRRTAFYTNLPKGHYTFRVKSCNNDGKWNEEGAAVQLSVAPFWWETWWAYALYFAALVLAFLGLRQYELKRARLRHELKLQHVRTERLQELDHLKSRFFAGISHEFRTPLTLISGPLAELLEDSRAEQARPLLTTMQRNTMRLQRLVDQLLDLAQLEGGKMALQARPVRLVVFLKALVAAFESYARQKGLGLELQVGDQLENEIVYFDPDKMEKVFINLLFNALKFTPAGGRVEVSVRKPDATTQQLEICVRDTGAGIPEKALPHIFDYFYRYREENTKRESGTGIGLALTKEIIALHHGEISVTSSEGVGSEFTIRLPPGKSHLKPEEVVSEVLWEEEALGMDLCAWAAFKHDGRESATPKQERGASANLPRILLVEDNADMRNYLRRHLQKGCHVLEAVDGAEGLKKALAVIPDLIVSDVMMPQKDGFELCRDLKSHELTSHIPIILLTAKGSGESKLEGLELGADDYLTKPVHGRELQLRVRNLITRQQKLQERFRQQLLTPGNNSRSLPISSADEKFLQRIMEVLEKHLADDKFGPEGLAQTMAMSRAHLNRKLRGLIGQRTGEFMRTMRLKRAAELLRQKTGSISEIAFQVGFNHLSYFARSFKEQYGQSPSEYQQAQD